MEKKVVFTLLVAYIGGLLVRKRNLPAPYLIGSIMSVTLMNLTTPYIYFPKDGKMYTQIITGSFIGAGITQRELKGMKEIFNPIIISLFSMILGMAVSGSVLYFVFGMDSATAYLSSVPGGIADITLMSEEFGADMSVVALIQTLRLVTVLVFLPLMISKIKFNNSDSIENNTRKEVKEDSFLNIFLTLCVGYLGARLTLALGIPAGSLSGSLFAVVLFNVFSSKASVPLFLKKIAQLCSGALVGSGITIESIRAIPSLILPIICVLVFYLVFNYGVSLVISKHTSMDRATAMFGTAPAGASDIVLIASEMDLEVNQTQIVLMHIARLISVLTIFPFIIKLIIQLLS